jgi:hypothetical protein
MDRPASGFFSRLLGSRRRRILLGLGLLALVVRAGLPFALRPLLVRRADEALVGRIELADLDLSLLRGGVTLHGFSVHTDERPSDRPPLFEAERLWTQISWLALLGRTIEIEELEVEGFDVRLDRFADGFDLPKPIPSDGPEPTDEATEDGGTSWSFAADAVSLRDGSFELADHTVQGEPERFEFGIEDLSARELAIRTKPGDEEPGRIAIEAMLDQGSVSLAAWVKQQENGLDVRGTLNLVGLPIDKVRAYLTMFEWDELTGRLDAALEYRSEPEGVHELRGRAALADVRVGVPNLDEPALAWESLEVVVDRIDLAKRVAEIESITSKGARIVVDPRAETPVALLASGAKPDAAEAEATSAVAAESARAAEAARSPDPAGAADPIEAAETPVSPEEAAPAFVWRIEKAILQDGVVALLGAPEVLPLRIEAELTSLSSDPEVRSPIALDLATPEGSLALDGEIAPTALAFDGKLVVADLALAPLFARIDAPALYWLRAGRLRTDLQIAFERDLRVAGLVGLSGLDLEEEKTAKKFGVEWKDLELALSRLTFADVLAEVDPEKPRTLDVALSRVRLVAPSVVLTRDENGLVLPPLVAGETAEPTDAESEPVASEAPVAVDPADPSAAPPAPAAEGDMPAAPAPTIAITLAIADARIEGGRGRIADRAIEPFYRGKIDAVDLHAVGVRWPERRVESLELALEGLRGASLALDGSIAPGDAKLEGKLVSLPLDQFNPYLASTGYALDRGALSLESKARFRSERFKTRSKVVVRELTVGGAEGEKAFQESFGIPLSVALGLLKDLDGKITLAVPVVGKRDSVDLGLGRIVGQALRKALVGALASPLKLLGAATKNGKVESLAPAPIAFEAGAAVLSHDGAERAEEIASLLAATPSISLVLTGQISSADERRLREQALLAELDRSGGLRALATLGERATRRAVRDHLAQKLAGAPAGAPLPPLDAAAARWLEEQIAARPLAPDALIQLAEARANHLRSLLAADHGIAETRIALAAPTIDPPAAEAGVSIALGGLASAR